MYFYKQKQKVNLSLEGCLLLHKSKEVATANVKSALPDRIHGGRSCHVGRRRFAALLSAMQFIYGSTITVGALFVLAGYVAASAGALLYAFWG